MKLYAGEQTVIYECLEMPEGLCVIWIRKLGEDHSVCDQKKTDYSLISGHRSLQELLWPTLHGSPGDRGRSGAGWVRRNWTERTEAS